MNEFGVGSKLSLNAIVRMKSVRVIPSHCVVDTHGNVTAEFENITRFESHIHNIPRLSQMLKMVKKQSVKNNRFVTSYRFFY